jgi:hypothetical protein
MERVIQVQQFDLPGAASENVVLQLHSLPIAATLGSSLGSRVVNENSPHHGRADREKMSLTLPTYARLINQPHVGLVDQRGGLESVAFTLTFQVAIREGMQFRINDGHELVGQRFRADLAGVRKEFCRIL